jgi:hypothetical protein
VYLTTNMQCVFYMLYYLKGVWRGGGSVMHFERVALAQCPPTFCTIECGSTDGENWKSVISQVEIEKSERARRFASSANRHQALFETSATS